MGFSRLPKYLTIHAGTATDGVGTTQLVNDYMNIMLKLATSGNADMTIKVQGSLQDPNDPPDFASAASPTNQWDYLATFDLNNPSAITVGSTGFVTGASDIVKNILVNTDGIVHLNVIISNWVAGALTATAVVYNNQ